MNKQEFPSGWNEARVKRLIDHYENMTDEELIAEDETAHQSRKNHLPVPSGAPKTNGVHRKKKSNPPKASQRGKRKVKRSQRSTKD